MPLKQPYGKIRAGGVNMKITIEVNEANQITTQMEGAVTLDTLTSILCTVQLGAMKQAVAQAEPGEQVFATQAIYERYNLAASNLLSTFAPEIEMRPDITEQAILELENKIIEQHWSGTKETDEEGV